MDCILYFSGLSLRRASERLSALSNETIMFPYGTGSRNNMLKRKILFIRERRFQHIINDTLIKVVPEYICL